MRSETKRVRILRMNRAESQKTTDIVVQEFPLTIVLNDVELVSLLCSPKNLDFLAMGFLFSEGLISSRREVSGIHVDKERGVLWVETTHKRKIPQGFAFRRLITTGCGKSLSLVNRSEKGAIRKVESDLTIPSGNIYSLMSKFQRRSELYKLTGGVHSAAICDRNRIVAFNEDIGRHNAIDKVIGECLMKGMALRSRILITSGRVSSEISIKVARSGIPVIVSKSAPTSLGVQLANELGITLIGFARGLRMNIYS
ncbi:MAG: formate dehydrogenase accessory sulfurtransferase FdhD, partial [Thermoplasmata archaeon]